MAAAAQRTGHTSMTAVAIYSADPVLRCSLEQLLREDPAMTVVGVADNPSAILRLIEQNHVDAVLADSPPHDQLAPARRNSLRGSC